MTDLAKELTDCYDKRRLPDWGTILEAAHEIERLNDALQKAELVAANAIIRIKQLQVRKL